MERDTPRKGRPRGFSGAAAQSKIQSLDRALDVLDALAAGKGMTLTDIAKNLGQSPATMYRVLTTLEARGMVETDPQSQLWHVGATTFRLGSAFLRRNNVIERSQPAMRHLMEATGETSNLGIERGGAVMFVAQVETQETIRAFFPPGMLSPMHASGIGKALLSCHAPGRIEDFLRARPLERFTEKTITSAEALRKELDRIQTAGYAYDDEERTTGMRCVAAPILDGYGKAVAGISISGPTHRMPADEIGRIGDLVRAAARRVSLDLGATGAD